MITELKIARDHGAYAGHFPGFPVLPGAVLLDEVLHEIARARNLDLLRWQVSSVKFLGIVQPGHSLTLEHDAPNGASIRFAIRNTQGTVASGLLSALSATPEEADGA
jgi:3-hydroxymyristoyl/3-hydroxydecanoyl-(acyl carrier protein) dehydratase